MAQRKSDRKKTEPINTINKVKYTESEILEQKIYRDIMNGKMLTEIYQKIMHQEYDNKKLSDRGANAVISTVKKRIRVDWQAESKELRENMLTRMLDLYTDCRANNDRKTAADVLKNITKVTGIDAPEKIDLNLEGEITINFD